MLPTIVAVTAVLSAQNAARKYGRRERHQPSHDANSPIANVGVVLAHQLPHFERYQEHHDPTDRSVNCEAPMPLAEHSADAYEGGRCAAEAQEESEKEVDKFEFFKIKFTDVLDLVKDHFYLLNFPHLKSITLILSSSIITPFVAFHCQSQVTCGWISSILMYLGLTTIKPEKEDRKNTGGLIIAFLENLP